MTPENPHSFLPRYHKRAFRHNYRAPFIYHIILGKQPSFPRFGEVEGDCRIPVGNPGAAFIRESLFGRFVAKSIVGLPYDFPFIRLHQFKVMPDHVHILLETTEWLEEDLDAYIDKLKDKVALKITRAGNKRVERDEIFIPGFCDKPLLLKRSLDVLYKYIDSNPHRLATRIQNPSFFRRTTSLRINNRLYEAYGNLFLMGNPEKEAVKISRRYSKEECENLRDKWLWEASRGTALVSPFISPAEKKIRAEAEAAGARVILIVPESFPERFKPSFHNFNLCSEGRLLIISMGQKPGSPLTRETCVKLNELAHEIAGN